MAYGKENTLLINFNKFKIKAGDRFTALGNEEKTHCSLHLSN